MLLTIDEITDALKKQRAIDVVCVPLKQKMGTITHFVICSGRVSILLFDIIRNELNLGESRRHLKTMASSLVTAVGKYIYELP